MDRILRWLVSGSLLLQAICTPGVAHAHAQGEHSHAPAHLVPSVAKCVSPAAGQAVLRTGPGQWHVHLHLLGLEFTLPTSEPEQSTPPGSDCQTLARLVSGGALQLPVAPAVPTSPLGHLALFRAAAELQVRHAPWPICVAHPPRLCDVARHERSGVQLA